MSWAAQTERGGAGVTKAAIAVALRGGRFAGAALCWVGTGWFLLSSPKARAASRGYLRRVLGREPRLADVARHFHAFAVAVLDRVRLLGGQEAGFSVTVEGMESVLGPVERGQGCILLGAHLGSFEVLRFVARHSPVPAWALMYRRNGGAFTRLLDRLAPRMSQHVLEIGDAASMLRARDCIARGELVGILADRAPAEMPGRFVRVPFLGGAAGFPSGPFVLAAMLGAPIVTFQAVRTGPGRYTVRFQPFRDTVTLARERREADLQALVASFAARLEQACRAYPLQWFNFFDFWGGDGGDKAARTGGVGVPGVGGGVPRLWRDPDAGPVDGPAARQRGAAHDLP